MSRYDGAARAKPPPRPPIGAWFAPAEAGIGPRRLPRAAFAASVAAALVLLTALPGPGVWAQETGPADDGGPENAIMDDGAAGGGEPAGEGAAAPAPPPELPTAFGTIELGMGVDAVKERLGEDPNFIYRGDPDVTLTPARQQELIEVEGTLFVERAFFQFEDEELYIIILQLNRRRLDYFTMYTDLEGKYGEPAVFEPSQVVWESDAVRMSLEKPLTVKYVARAVFEELVAAGEMERSQRDISREEFLEQF